MVAASKKNRRGKKPGSFKMRRNSPGKYYDRTSSGLKILETGDYGRYSARLLKDSDGCVVWQLLERLDPDDEESGKKVIDTGKALGRAKARREYKKRLKFLVEKTKRELKEAKAEEASQEDDGP